MCGMLRKSKDPIESRFEAMMKLIKDLDKSDYRKLKEAMDLSFDAYQKIKNIDSADIISVKDFILHKDEPKGKK